MSAYQQAERDDIFPLFERLWPNYREYCLTVSRRGMAASIETCAFVVWLCGQKKARRVADLGSGFSSFALREYAALTGGVHVSSVDDNKTWLKATANYLAGHGLSTDGLIHSEQWRTQDGLYDVIFYDFAGGAVREEWMPVAVSRLAPDGVIVFDDAQHPSHHLKMAEVSRAAGLALFDIYQQTIDEVGRYAVMAHR